MAPGAGIEPATNALTVRDSTAELPRNWKYSAIMRPDPDKEKLQNPNDFRGRAAESDISSHDLEIVLVPERADQARTT